MPQRTPTENETLSIVHALFNRTPYYVWLSEQPSTSIIHFGHPAAPPKKIPQFFLETSRYTASGATRSNGTQINGIESAIQQLIPFLPANVSPAYLERTLPVRFQLWVDQLPSIDFSAQNDTKGTYLTVLHPVVQETALGMLDRLLYPYGISLAAASTFQNLQNPFKAFKPPMPSQVPPLMTDPAYARFLSEQVPNFIHFGSQSLEETKKPPTLQKVLSTYFNNNWVALHVFNTLLNAYHGDMPTGHHWTLSELENHPAIISWAKCLDLPNGRAVLKATSCSESGPYAYFPS